MLPPPSIRGGGGTRRLCSGREVVWFRGGPPNGLKFDATADSGLEEGAELGLVPPLLNDTHIHGRWEEDQKRFDISIKGAFPQPDAHGVIGQSYQDTRVRNGKLDTYAIEQASVDGSAAKF